MDRITDDAITVRAYAVATERSSPGNVPIMWSELRVQDLDWWQQGIQAGVETFPAHAMPLAAAP